MLSTGQQCCRTYHWDSRCTSPHQPMSTDRQDTAAPSRSPTPPHTRTRLGTAPSTTTSSSPTCHQSCQLRRDHCTVTTQDQTCCRTGRSDTGHCMRLCPAQPPHRTAQQRSCCTRTTRPRCTNLADTLPLSHSSSPHHTRTPPDIRHCSWTTSHPTHCRTCQRYTARCNCCSSNPASRRTVPRYSSCMSTRLPRSTVQRDISPP